jgi:hypothetical protein
MAVLGTALGQATTLQIDPAVAADAQGFAQYVVRHKPSLEG